MAWYFDEIAASVQLTDHAALTLPDGDWTIAGSVKWPDHAGAGNQWLLSWGGHGAEPSIGWYMEEATGILKVWSEDAEGDRINFDSVGTPGTSTAWQHLVLRRSGTTVTQYVNGVADGTDTEALYGSINVAGNLFLGRLSTGGNFFGGYMAELAKWDRALSVGEIAAHAKGFSPRCFPGRRWHVEMIRPYQELMVPPVVVNDGSTVAPHPPIIYPFGPPFPGPPPAMPWLGIPCQTDYGRGRVFTLAWVSSTSGDVEYELDGRAGRPLLRGILHRVETCPGEAGAPSVNWDLALEDEWGADVLGGLGANRSATESEPIFPYFSFGTSGHGERGVGGGYTLKISNAGAGKAGRVRILTLDP